MASSFHDVYGFIINRYRKRESLHDQANTYKRFLFSDSSLPLLPLFPTDASIYTQISIWLTGIAFRIAMAITHDDLSIRNYRTADISSRLALLLVGLSVLCGLVGFILCLAGEASRSEATWMVLTIQDSGKGYRCSYSGSGKTPLAFALTAFLLFALAMFTEHAYMLVAITSPSPPAVVALPVRIDPSAVSPASKALTWQACFLFLTTWICFAVAEVLLMITIGVESGHLYNWTKPRVTCPAVRPGLFATAGVFGLTTVFLGVALYLTALRTQRLHLEEENMQRQQHLRPTAPPQEPPAIRAYQSQEPRGTSYVNKTSTSA